MGHHLVFHELQPVVVAGAAALSDAGHVATCERLARRVGGEKGGSTVRHKLGDEAGKPRNVIDKHGVGHRMSGVDGTCGRIATSPSSS